MLCHVSYVGKGRACPKEWNNQWRPRSVYIKVCLEVHCFKDECDGEDDNNHIG